MRLNFWNQGSATGEMAQQPSNPRFGGLAPAAEGPFIEVRFMNIGSLVCASLRTQ